MKKLRIGDKVITNDPTGKGRLIAITDGVCNYLVQLDNFNEGHSGHLSTFRIIEGVAPKRDATNCYYFFKEDLALDKESKFKNLIKEYEAYTERSKGLD